MKEKYKIDKKIAIRSFIIFIAFYCSSYLQYIPVLLFNIDTTKLAERLDITIALSCFSSIIFAGILLFVYRKDLKKEFKKYIKNWLSNIDTGFKWYFVGLMIMMLSNLFLYYVLKSGGANNENTVQTMITASPILMALEVCILAPFNEEIVFRKTLYDVFKHTKLFILLSFLLFGGAHVISNATTMVDYLYIIPYGALGAAFAKAYNETDSVFTSMSFHILHNTCLFLLSVMF